MYMQRDQLNVFFRSLTFHSNAQRWRANSYFTVHNINNTTTNTMSVLMLNFILFQSLCNYTQYIGKEIRHMLFSLIMQVLKPSTNTRGITRVLCTMKFSSLMVHSDKVNFGISGRKQIR